MSAAPPDAAGRGEPADPSAHRASAHATGRSHGPDDDATGATGATADGALDAPLLAALRAAVGDAHVIVGAALAERASHFWDPTPLAAAALVRPATTDEVAATLRACTAAGRSVVTHGGVTGLAGGDRAGSRDVVLSLERMRAIESIDPVGRTMTVEAGVVLETAQRAAAEHGLELGIDLGARGSCTIGGNIATNAGGLSVLRHGMTREQVLGMEAVLADGTVLRAMNRMMKNNTGYDWKHLLVGSEGTLGIVTRAVLKLRPATPHVRTALLACERFDQVTGLLARLGAALDGSLAAYEVMWNRFYALNTDPAHEGHVGAPLARDFPLYVLVDARGADEAALEARFGAAMEGAMEAGLVADAVLAQSERERAALWRIREHIEIALAHDPVFTYDVSLPVVDMARYLEGVETELAARFPELAFYAYGHLADGNLHVLVAPLPIGAPAPDTAEEEAWHAASDAAVYGPLAALGGSVSAEHGIGLHKRAWLHVSRGPEELELMRAIKRVMDPTGTLNPGKIL